MTQTGFNLSGGKLRSLDSQLLNDTPSDDEYDDMTPISPIKESMLYPLSPLSPPKKKSNNNVK